MDKRRDAGFTLVELMLVIVIIAVMVAMVVPRLTGRSEQARKTAAEADINANLSLALDLYEMDNGTYPSTEQGLEALRTKPSTSPAPVNWRGPYIKRPPMDPWGREYHYKSPGIHNAEDYDLSSLGPDGVESEDDVGNWGK